MSESVGLQALIEEYARLRRLEGHTEQSRGQRFNGLIAEMLQCFGIDARDSMRNKGEIDVGFGIESAWFIVEAKWTAKPADTGQIAKLQKRVRQRFSGTTGIFLSMAGYSEVALTVLADGERLEVLLLDGGHFEAMLSGLVPPQELLTLAREHASYSGVGYAPLATLLDRSLKAPVVEFDAGAVFPEGVLAYDAGSDGAEVLFTLPESNQLGIATRDTREILVTTQDGIVEVDLAGRVARWAVPVPGCHRNPGVDADGSIVFTRRHGVGRYCDGQVTVLGGGLVGNTCLAPHPNGTLWVFANGDLDRPPGASITRLGESVGDEVRYELDHPGATGCYATWVSETELLTVGKDLLITSVEAGTTRRFDVSQVNPWGFVAVNSATVAATANNELSFDGRGGLYVASYAGPSHRIVVARLPLAGLAGRLPAGEAAVEQRRSRADLSPSSEDGERLAPARPPVRVSRSEGVVGTRPRPIRWRAVKGGPETAGLTSGLRETIGPHQSSIDEASPSLRVGIAIPAGPLPLTGPETRQLRRWLLELLGRPPFASFTAAVIPELPALSWQSYGNGRRTSYAAILSAQPTPATALDPSRSNPSSVDAPTAPESSFGGPAAVSDPSAEARPSATGVGLLSGGVPAPVGWMRLVLPQPDESSFGRDPRCANFVLHLEWRSPDGAGRPALGLAEWEALMRLALSLPAALAEFLSGQLNLPPGDEPPVKIGFWLSTPSDRNLASLVDIDGLPRLAGSQLSRWFDAYAIADDDGSLADDVARSWRTHLGDEYLYLD